MITGAHVILYSSDADADRAALLDLERAVTAHPEFAVLADLGTSLHVIATRP